MADEEIPQKDATPEDPWQKLSPQERKRAERHLVILYAAMILMVVIPFFVLYYLKK